MMLGLLAVRSLDHTQRMVETRKVVFYLAVLRTGSLMESVPFSRFSARFSLMDFVGFFDSPLRGDLSDMMCRLAGSINRFQNMGRVPHGLILRCIRYNRYQLAERTRWHEMKRTCANRLLTIGTGPFLRASAYLPKYFSKPAGRFKLDGSKSALAFWPNAAPEGAAGFLF